MKYKDLLLNKKKLHFIGIGGSGMFPIVQILHSKGYIITGSDVNTGDIIDSETKMGIQIFMGHKSSNVHGADLIIYSAAINMENPEILEAKKHGIPYVERSVMLGYLTALYSKPICIAGTHGKTTTTAMTTQALLTSNIDTAAVIGGKLPYINGYGKSGTSDIVAIESCEYHNTFHELTPSIAVLLNVDADHLEFFGNMENLKNSFRKFCNSSRDYIVYNIDDKQSCEVVEGLNIKLISFGLNENSDFRAINIKNTKGGYYSFDILHNDLIIANLNLHAPGKHNIYNALASFTACALVGADAKLCAEGISNFYGAGRRFEILSTNNNITIADDYAHHPTEIASTLTAAKQMGYNKIWAVFQPFTYSRTKILLDDFASALKIADNVVMTEIMGGRETNDNYNIYTKDLADKIPNSVYFNTFEEVANYTIQHASKNDLIITLGCGDIYKCAKMMVKLIN